MIKQAAVHVCDRAGCGKKATILNDCDGNDWCPEHWKQEVLRCLIAKRDEKQRWLEATHLKDLADLDAKIAHLKAEGVVP